MVDHGKRFEAVEKLVEAGKEYTPAEAIALAKKTATAKFDETVEMHLRMGLDPRNSAQTRCSPDTLAASIQSDRGARPTTSQQPGHGLRC